MNGAIGERDLIRRISVILGGLENDDCAVIDAGERYLVASTDMLHQKTDFPDIMNPWQMGWMAVAVNLSDIAAMGAEPAGVLIAAGLPPEADQYFIDELFSGFGDCAALYGTRILGGDTDSHLELTITGTSLGFVEKELILRRRGARAGDLLCTTGSLGAAGGGLWAWQNGMKSELITSLLEPEPRLKEGRALAKSGSVTAMMDNSDGLALSLSDLSEVSGVGFLVYQDKLPLAPGLVEMVGAGECFGDGIERGWRLRAGIHPALLGPGGGPKSVRSDGYRRGGGGGNLDGKGREEKTDRKIGL
jgi:thiamine-monophosphate kinase